MISSVQQFLRSMDVLFTEVTSVKNEPDSLIILCMSEFCEIDISRLTVLIGGVIGDVNPVLMSYRFIPPKNQKTALLCGISHSSLYESLKWKNTGKTVSSSFFVLH